MLRRFSVDFAIFSMIVDGLVAAGALRLAVLLRPALDDITPLAREFRGPIHIDAPLYPVFALVWVLVLFLFSVYDARRNFRVADELTQFTLGSLLAAVVLAGLLYLSFRDISRALFLSFVLFAYLGMLLVRLLYRAYYALNRQKGVQVRRVLIVGAGEVGKRVAENIQLFENIGLQLEGFLDDDPRKLKNPRVLGHLGDARRIIAQRKIEDVVLALPGWAFQKISRLTSELHDLPVRVWVVPDYFALALNKAKIDEFADIPMIDLRAPALNDYQRMAKRAFDLVMTIVLMPFVLPLMGVLALLIKLDSPGPVLFPQERAGENGRLFKMLKFRTMVVDAEKYRHVVENKDETGRIIQDKKRRDPRITRIGRFLRKTSLDELPQFFNVLKGEMSLVGPRPELPYLVEQYQPWQRRRFAVPQGMTGWWQVNGRSDKPMHQNTEEDLYYVQNYSIWLDIVILLKTLWVVLRGKGAY